MTSKIDVQRRLKNNRKVFESLCAGSFQAESGALLSIKVYSEAFYPSKYTTADPNFLFFDRLNDGKD